MVGGSEAEDACRVLLAAGAHALASMANSGFLILVRGGVEKTSQ